MVAQFVRADREHERFTELEQFGTDSPHRRTVPFIRQ